MTPEEKAKLAALKAERDRRKGANPEMAAAQAAIDGQTSTASDQTPLGQSLAKLKAEVAANPKLQTALAQQSRMNANKAIKSGKLSKEDLVDMNKVAVMSDEDIVSNFLTGIEHNYALQDKFGNKIKTKDWGKNSSTYVKDIEDLGKTPLNETQRRSFQNTYGAAVDLAQSKSDDPEIKNFFTRWDIAAAGESKPDHKRAGFNVSRPDSKWESTTVGQGLFEKDPGATIPSPDLTKVAVGDKLDEIKTNPLGATYPEVPAQYWLQDIIKTAGAFGDKASIKKYMPWQGSYNPTLPDPTFYDPTRELAANAEQANIASQAAGMFAGPQGLSAKLAAIQGQGATNAANVLGKYNNMNVGVANQFAGQRAGIMNNYNQNQANQATRLYDKTTIVNQQFDNSQNMARQNLRQSYLDALTNRGQTQAMNNLIPQFAVNPMTGGTTYFRNPREINQEMPQNKTMIDTYNELLKSTGDKDTALKLMSVYYGKGT